MTTFFLHNSEIYGIMIDPSSMTLNPQNVLTFNFAGPGSAPVFKTLVLTNLPTAPDGLPSGSVWKQGDFLCIAP